MDEKLELTLAEIEDLEATEQKAWAGPWIGSRYGQTQFGIGEAGGPASFFYKTAEGPVQPIDRSTANLIVKMRNALPALCAMARRATSTQKEN